MGRLGQLRRRMESRTLLRTMAKDHPPPAEQTRVDLGCGRKKAAGYLGVDIAALPGVDVVCDIASEGLPFDDSSVDEVRAHDFLEHMRDPIFIMNEIHRVLRPNGLADLFVPSTDGRGAFQDPTHVSFWNQNSFDYYLRGGAREVLGYYGIRCEFVAERLRTTRMNRFGVCWVEARLRAVKT